MKHSVHPAQIKKPRKKVVLSIGADHLHWLHGLMMVKHRRFVTWKEICRLTGVSPWTIRNIVSGYARGGKLTINRLMKLRDHGLMIHLSDFQVQPPPPPPPPPPSTSESSQTSQQ